MDEVKISTDIKVPVVKRLLAQATTRGLIYPFANCNSPNRLMLAVSAFKQAIYLMNGAPPRVESMYSPAVLKSHMNKESDGNYKTYRHIEKWISGRKTHKDFYVLVDHEKHVIHCYEHHKYVEMNEKYGYINETKITADGIKDGEYISRSTNYRDDGVVWGKDKYTVYNISAKSIEDSVWMSDETAKDLSYMNIWDFQKSVSRSSLLKNLYGTLDLYKPIPTVGDIVRDDDIIMAIYESPLKHQFIRSKQTLNEVTLKDQVYYAKAGSEVVDIDVLYHNSDIEDKYLYGLYTECMKYYQDINNAILDACRDHPSYTISFDTNYWMDRTWNILNGAHYRVDQNTVNKNSVFINITLMKVEPLKPGHKLTGRHGNKGVTSEIVTDEDDGIVIERIFKHGLFRDKDGVPVDIVLNTKGVINRSNMGQLYEKTTNDFFDNILKKFRKDREDKSIDYARFKSVLMGTLYWVAPEQHDMMMQDVFKPGVSDIPKLNEILDNDLTIYINPYPEEACHPVYKHNVFYRFYEASKALKAEGINIGKRELWIHMKDGKKIKMNSIYEVAKMYFVVMEHSPEKKFIVRSQGSYDAKGSLTKTNDKKQSTIRYGNTPIKIGERDFAILTSILPAADMKEFIQTTESDTIDTFRSFLNSIGADYTIEV